MSQNNGTKPYHSLIHLGCGVAPNIDEYLALAEHVWLVDADSQVLDNLGTIVQELENVHIVQALADTEQRSGILYRYSLPWANGPIPVDDATQRLYPGLRSQGIEEQPTTAVDTVLSQCLPEAEDQVAHLLLLDVGNYNATLLQALENSGLLGRLATVIVLPAHRRQQPVPVPPSLLSAETSPNGLTLPSNSQVLARHPLLLKLEHAKNQLAECGQQVDKTKRSVIKQADEYAQSLTIEQEKSAQLEKERDQYLHQRDDLKLQLEAAIKERDDALHQNHLNYQAKSAAENRVSELQDKLIEANKLAESLPISLEDKNPETNLTDGFYRALEDKFRGAREDIKQRVSVYLSFVQPIAERNPGVPALDLGCGRGEWLEVLKAAEIAGHGIDQDAGMLDGCQVLGLSVEQGDAIAYLGAQPDASRICISLIHVVEHIPFDSLREIVAEAKRVLVPDGILIMETPNPENYTVGSCNFYMDPTHRNPLPPPLLAFVPEYYSYERVKVLRLQETSMLHDKPGYELSDLLRGVSPDYAVIAQVKQTTTETSAGQREQIAWEQYYGLSLDDMIRRNAQID
ncbi:methyltransferase domain-containing protein [Saccharospirillum sp.]|uniref:methyltransferase domain-containing protein n=1 Tax=Saccharospirillum sp. TaxID=2033801 RepID=UPI0034A04142